MVPSLVVMGSVVVDDLDVIGATVAPGEAEAELIIDPDAVLAAAISREKFEAVPGSGLTESCLIPSLRR
jgi:hypothetical protein